MESSEKELIQRCLDGDTSSFGILYNQYQNYVYNIIYRMVGDAEDAEDLKQETFFLAYKSLARFRCDCKFSTWLYRIATNQTLNYRHKHVTEREKMADVDIERVPCGGNIGISMERSELQTQVQKILCSLPSHHRIILILRDFEELSYEEIAEILGCSVNAVSVRLHRARMAFKTAISPFLVEEISQLNPIS